MSLADIAVDPVDSVLSVEERGLPRRSLPWHGLRVGRHWWSRD